MMKWVALAVSIAALGCAGSASAAVLYDVTLTGTLTSSCNCGTDAPKVGDTITLTAQFDGSVVQAWGGSGYSVAGLYGAPTTGPTFWNLTLDGFQWNSRNEEMDGGDPIFSNDEGLPGYSKTISSPDIMFAGGKVFGVGGYMVPTGTSAVPVINLGSTAYFGGSVGTDRSGDVVASFSPLNLSSAFDIQAGNGLYGNDSPFSGSGTWDFADSIVTVVPEPDIWAMVIGGFGLLGLALRRRRAIQLAA
jgi:hypothetical protein